MGRRSSGGTLTAILFLAGLLGWVLSKVWMHILVGGGAVLLGWMGWMLVRSVRSSMATRPHLVPARAQRSLQPPQEKYRALLDVDPKVFDDSVLAEATALQVFNMWTRQLEMAPADCSDLVRALELRIRHVGRLETQLVRRQLEWRESPYGGSQPVTGPKLLPDALDPWSTTSNALRTDSAYVASCERCRGDGQATCPTCNGTTRATCSECKGARKMYGLAANGSRRLLNCKACKGKGDLKCTLCERGKTTCGSCHGMGRIERWLEIVEEVRTDIQVEPDGEITKAFPWGTDGTPATQDELRADAKILAESRADGPVPQSDISRRLPPEWLAEHWLNLQPSFGSAERVKRQSLCLLEVPSIEVTYALGADSETISFQGRRMLTPSTIEENLFRNRSRKIRRIRYGLLVAALAVPVAYLSRGTYFWSVAVAALILHTTSAIWFVDTFVRSATLGRISARKWAAGAAVCVFAACGLAIATEPSEQGVRRLIAAEALTPARAELTALGTPESPSRAVLWADLALGEARTAADVGVIAAKVRDIPAGLPQRNLAQQRLYIVTSQRVLQELTAHNPPAAAAVLAQAQPAVQEVSDGVLAAQFSELSARLRDEEYAQCETDVCRWKTAIEAHRATASSTREERVNVSRNALTQALTFQLDPKESSVSRLKKLTAMSKVAESVLGADKKDPVTEVAQVALTFTATERARVALVGAENRGGGRGSPTSNSGEWRDHASRHWIDISVLLRSKEPLRRDLPRGKPAGSTRFECPHSGSRDQATPLAGDGPPHRVAFAAEFHDANKTRVLPVDGGRSVNRGSLERPGTG